MNPETQLAWWRIIGTAREAVLDAIRALARARADERMTTYGMDAQTEKKSQKKDGNLVDTRSIPW